MDSSLSLAYRLSERHPENGALPRAGYITHERTRGRGTPGSGWERAHTTTPASRAWPKTSGACWHFSAWGVSAHGARADPQARGRGVVQVLDAHERHAAVAGEVLQAGGERLGGLEPEPAPAAGPVLGSVSNAESHRIARRALNPRIDTKKM